MSTADSKKPCPHCGGEHIAPGTVAAEYAQANRWREQEGLDIQAERLAWYEHHWDLDDPEVWAREHGRAARSFPFPRHFPGQVITS